MRRLFQDVIARPMAICGSPSPPASGSPAPRECSDSLRMTHERPRQRDGGQRACGGEEMGAAENIERGTVLETRWDDGGGGDGPPRRRVGLGTRSEARRRRGANSFHGRSYRPVRDNGRAWQRETAWPTVIHLPAPLSLSSRRRPWRADSDRDEMNDDMTWPHQAARRATHHGRSCSRSTATCMPGARSSQGCRRRPGPPRRGPSLTSTPTRPWERT